MTLVAARDLRPTADPRLHDRARHLRHPDPRTGSPTRCKARLGAQVPAPGAGWAGPTSSRRLALHILDNPYLNGETIRLDGAGWPAMQPPLTHVRAHDQ